MRYNKQGREYRRGERMKMIRVVIVEDETDAAETLVRFVKRYGDERGIDQDVRVFADGLTFLGVAADKCDIVFMDIELPELDGFETARRLRARDDKTCIIFVTNMSGYAIRGYDVDAMGFVVKPATYFALSVLMDKAVKRCERLHGSEILIGSGDDIHRLMPDDIYYIEVMDHFLVYHTRVGDIRVYGQLGRAAGALRDKGFFRCHKSYVVNLDYVTEVKRDHVFVNKERVPISRGIRGRIVAEIARRLGGM